jgi:GAF domain-containing protein
MDVPRPRDDGANGDHFVELTRLLLSTDSLSAFLSELVAYAHAQTGHSCSITVRGGHGDPFTVAASDELARTLDEQQYGVNNGPCLEALATGAPVLVTDMAVEPRWAPYPARAAELGARSSMSYPLITGDEAFGALNLYAPSPLVPDVALQARAAQLADRAAGAVAVGLRLREDREQGSDLRAALSARSTVDQAIGILVAQQRCSVEEAFALLRQTSQTRNIKVRDVAAQIVASAQRQQSGRSHGRY